MLPSVLPRLGTDSAVRMFPGVWKLPSFCHEQDEELDMRRKGRRHPHFPRKHPQTWAQTQC